MPTIVKKLLESINIADRDMLLWAGSPNEFDGNNANVFELIPSNGLNNDNVNNRNNAARGVFSLQSEYYYTKRCFMNVITLMHIMDRKQAYSLVLYLKRK